MAKTHGYIDFKDNCDETTVIRDIPTTYTSRPCIKIKSFK